MSMPFDSQVFALRVSNKTSVLILVLPLTVVACLCFSGIASMRDHRTVEFVMVFISWLIVIPVSAAQIHRVARILGPRLTNLMAMRLSIGDFDDESSSTE